MLVKREVQEIVCDACYATVNNNVKIIDINHEKKLKHFCPSCSKRIVDFQLYKDKTLDDAIKDVIDEGQYKKSLNIQGIMLCWKLIKSL